MHPPGKTLVVLTVALLSLIWGTTWAAIRIGLQGVPPFTGVAFRFALASIVLLAGQKLLGGRFEGSRREKWLWVANALLSFCASYGILYWSEQWVPSGLASVLFATFPFFVAILAHFSLPEEPLRPRTLIGMTIGFLGVAAIFSDDLSKLGGPGVALASGVLLLAPIASALSNVAIKKWGGGLHPISLTAVPMGIAAGVMGAVAMATERGRTFHWNATSIGAIAYLAIPGSAVTFMLYYWLLQHLPATRVALIAYLSPVVAVTIGSIFLDEPYTSRMLLGSALVVAGVAFATRPVRRREAKAAAAIVVMALAGAALAGERPVVLPADEVPAVILSLGPVGSFARFAIADDEASAAGAGVFGAERKDRTTVTVALAGRPAQKLLIDGEVRALRFGPDGALYVLVGRTRGGDDPGEAFLRRIDLTAADKPLEIRVPATALDMDLATEGTAFLVACRNEIRVVLFPDLRSPRLFRVEGDNRSIAAIAGGTQVLLGRSDGLVLVDLNDPQPREGLPIRERISFESPVVSLVASPYRPVLVARLVDGKTFDVMLDPLRMEPRGESTAILWPGAKVRDFEQRFAQPPSSPSAAEQAQPDAAGAVAAAEVAAQPERDAATRTEPLEEPKQEAPAKEPASTTQSTAEPAAPTLEAAPADPPAPSEAATPPPSTPPSDAEVAPPGPAPTPPSDAAPAAASERAADAPTPLPPSQAGAVVRGRLTGPAASQVQSVILLGPDNLLREALRVAPAADGSWAAGPLAPGAYRIVLDAGGRNAVVSDPPYARVVVPASGDLVAPAMTVTKILGP